MLGPCAHRMLHFGDRTISRASARDSWFCEPASLRECLLSVAAARTVDQSITGRTCDPAIRDMQIGDVRREMFAWLSGKRRREIEDPQNDKGDFESLRPTRVSKSREAGFQIAFGNQTFSSAVRRLWGRLSALRPYLAAGLPSSVQSLLKRTALKESNQGGGQRN